MLLIVSLPGLVILAMLITSIYFDGLGADIDFLSVVFSGISCFLVYLAATGDKDLGKADKQKN
jgi:hypothetical protein